MLALVVELDWALVVELDGALAALEWGLAVELAALEHKIHMLPRTGC